MIHLQISPSPVALPDSVPALAQESSMLKSLTFDEFIDKFVSSTVSFAINLAIAIAIFYIGRWIINKLYRLVHNIFISEL